MFFYGESLGFRMEKVEMFRKEGWSVVLEELEYWGGEFGASFEGGSGVSKVLEFLGG